MAPPDAAKASLLQRGLRVGGFAVGLGLFAYTLRDLDPDALGRALTHLGPLFLLILLPQAVGMFLHTAAWKELLAALKARAPFFALLDVYVGAEAVRMALPAGPAISESLSVWGVKTRFELPWTRSLAAVAAKKAWVLCTHALCFLVLLAAGGAALAKFKTTMPMGAMFTWVAVGMAAFLSLSGLLTLALLASRRAGRAVTSVLAKIPVASIRAWAEDQRSKPEAAAAANIPARTHFVAAMLLLGQWATEVIETWLILHLLGIPITLTEALVVELGGSLVRSAAFMIPGGLGVQDASYVSLIQGLGVSTTSDGLAAFVLLKRTKDVFYVVLGLALFALARKKSVRVALLEKPL